MRGNSRSDEQRPDTEAHFSKWGIRDEAETSDAQSPEAKAEQAKQDEQPDTEGHSIRSGG